MIAQTILTLAAVSLYISAPVEPECPSLDLIQSGLEGTMPTGHSFMAAINELQLLYLWDH